MLVYEIMQIYSDGKSGSITHVLPGIGENAPVPRPFKYSPIETVGWLGGCGWQLVSVVNTDNGMFYWMQRVHELDALNGSLRTPDIYHRYDAK